MRNACRFGDLISHGGKVITSSDNVFTNNRGATRLYDLVDCDIHGINSIVTSSNNVFVNGRGRVRIDDICQCGAIIVTGSPNVFVN